MLVAMNMDNTDTGIIKKTTKNKQTKKNKNKTTTTTKKKKQQKKKTNEDIIFGMTQSVYVIQPYLSL